MSYRRVSASASQRNMTLIVVTHDEDIARGAQRNVRIRDGRIWSP